MATKDSGFWKAAIDRYGLRVWCPRCGARGRFKPNQHGHRHRLREVRCDRTLSTGDACGGRLKVRNRDAAGNARDWPHDEIPWASTIGRCW